MQQPLISIIIPTFNRAALLAETLNSAKVQSYTNWECLIIDDGSTDNTEQVVAQFAKEDHRFRYFKRPAHLKKGANACRNFGFTKAKGTYINWFDDDDVMLENFLSARISEFKDAIIAVIGIGIYIDGNRNKIKPMRYNHQVSLFAGVVSWYSEVITNCVLFKKEFLNKVALFDENISRGQETEFFSRIFFNFSAENYTIINEPIFLYRQHATSKTSLNKKYVPVQRASHAKISLINFKRSLTLKNSFLVEILYKNMIYHFFRAVEHNDKKNSTYILKYFTPELRKINKLLAYKFYAIGILLKFLGRGFFKIEMYFKHHKL